MKTLLLSLFLVSCASQPHEYNNWDRQERVGRDTSDYYREVYGSENYQFYQILYFPLVWGTF